MAPPQFRTATQTRRSARAGGYPEPDDFEGLPVRQWRQEWVNAAPSPQQEMTQTSDRWAVELPYGMPRESHLLPPHTQELLRAARSGRLYKRPAPVDDEDVDAELDAIKGEKKDWDAPSDGFMVKTWKQVSRNAESPTTSYLAKRHKNTVTLASRAVAAPAATGPTMIRATVRRIDAAGNSYEETVNLTEGKQVDGEIISTTVVPITAAAHGERAPQQQPTPPVRRRPPPPKRKAKGLGRGRKKGKLPLPPPATRSQPAAAEGDAPVKTEGVGADGIKIEQTEDSTNQDSEMADMSGIPSEDEEGDGGDGEDDEEGEEDGGEDQGGETPGVQSASDDAQVQEMDDLVMSEAIQPSTVEEPDEPRPAAPIPDEEVTIPKVRFQPPNLTNLGPPLSAVHSRVEGSPLKNVMILSPTEASPMISPQAGNTSFATSSYLEVQSRTTGEPGFGNTIQQSFIAEAMVQDVPDPAGQDQVSQPVESVVAEELVEPNTQPLPIETLPLGFPREVTEITTDTPVQADEAPATEEPPAAPQPPAESTTAPSEPAPTEPLLQPAPATAETEPSSSSAPATAPEISLQPPDSPALLPTVTEDEDDGLNLLGSLERELDRQEGMSNASSSSGGGGSGGVLDDKIVPVPESAPAEAAATEGMVMDVEEAPAAAASSAGAEGQTEEVGAENANVTGDDVSVPPPPSS